MGVWPLGDADGVDDVEEAAGVGGWAVLLPWQAVRETVARRAAAEAVRVVRAVGMVRIVNRFLGYVWIVPSVTVDHCDQDCDAGDQYGDRGNVGDAEACSHVASGSGGAVHSLWGPGDHRPASRDNGGRRNAGTGCELGKQFLPGTPGWDDGAIGEPSGECRWCSIHRAANFGLAEGVPGRRGSRRWATDPSAASGPCRVCDRCAGAVAVARQVLGEPACECAHRASNG